MYKIFEDKYIEIMPKLISEGFKPLTFEQICKLRLEDNSYFDKWLDTCSMIVYHPNGKFKIVNDSELLKSVNKDTNLVDGAIGLTEKEYKNIKSKEFSREGLKFNECLTKEEVLSHPIWNALITNKKLLKDYTHYVFNHVDGKNMSVGISSPDKILARAWFMNRLNYGSGADGRFIRDGLGGRLVGYSDGVAEKEKADYSGFTIKQIKENIESKILKDLDLNDIFLYECIMKGELRKIQKKLRKWREKI